MEKREIYIIAVVLLVSIGIRVLRAKMGKKKGDTAKPGAKKDPNITSDSQDDYEPYSNK